MRLLSIDPGSSKAAVSHTGIVLLDVPTSAQATLVESLAVPNGLVGFRDWYFAEQPKPDLVVCEEFVNRNIRGADISPLLTEGAVRFLWPEAVLQPAAGKNTAVSDKALANLGFSKSAFGGDHHQDRWEALRHAVWFLKKRKHLPTLQAGWPAA